MPTLPRWFRVTWVAIVVASIALTALGCSSADESAQDVAVTNSASAPAAGSVAPSPDDMYAEEAARGDGAEAQKVTDADRMVIRTKTLRLEVESTTDTLEDIRGLIKTHGGTIQDLQVATDTDEWLYRYDEYGYATGDGAALRGWVTVRVPAASFEPFVADVIGLGEVRFQAEDSEDVTQQHVDLSARLANLKAEEERLRTFFDSAKDVKDMLAIETELNRVRQEIESLDAQVKYLERQAAMATITIELTEPRPVVRPSGGLGLPRCHHQRVPHGGRGAHVPDRRHHRFGAAVDHRHHRVLHRSRDSAGPRSRPWPRPRRRSGHAGPGGSGVGITHTGRAR